MEACLEGLEFVCEIGEVAVEVGQLPAGVDCRFGRAVVAGAGDEFEELVNVAVKLQDCIAESLSHLNCEQSEDVVRDYPSD